MSTFTFHKTKATESVWAAIEASPDSSVFSSRQWHSFLERLHEHTIIISVKDGDDSLIAYFVGCRKWYGIGLVGAPFGGSATYLGGLCASSAIDAATRVEVYRQLAAWLFRKHLASYLQVTDWQLRTIYPDFVPFDTWRHPLLQESGIHHTLRVTFHIDISVGEEALWRKTSYSSFRYCVNKANKEGLKVRFITRREDIPSFIETLNRQIQDVSRRKGVAPHMHQKPDRLRKLCESLFPNRVLMIQVIGNDDNGQQQVMSSAIFCLDKEVGTYLSGASFQRYMKFCPNEIMVWEGLRELYRRGVHHLILGDMAKYKLKFGPDYAYLPMMIFSRAKVLLNARADIKRFYWSLRNIITKK